MTERRKDNKRRVLKEGEYQRWNRGLKDEERAALTAYTTQDQPGNFNQVNTPLRTGQWAYPVDQQGTLADMTPQQIQDVKAQRKLMDSAISKFNLPEPMVVHRGSGPELLGNLVNPEDIMQRYGGRTVRDPGYMSTSAVLGSKFNKQIHYKITVPAGNGHGAYVKPMSAFPEENEFLLRRGAGFTVNKAYLDRFKRTVVEMSMNG